MNNLNDEAPSNAAHWHKVATDALAEIDRLKLQVAVADWVKRDAASCAPPTRLGSAPKPRETRPCTTRPLTLRCSASGSAKTR